MEGYRAASTYLTKPHVWIYTLVTPAPLPLPPPLPTWFGISLNWISTVSGLLVIPNPDLLLDTYPSIDEVRSISIKKNSEIWIWKRGFDLCCPRLDIAWEGVRTVRIHPSRLSFLGFPALLDWFSISASLSSVYLQRLYPGHRCRLAVHSRRIHFNI